MLLASSDALLVDTVAEQTIYVELFDESVDVWRPVDAEVEARHVFRLPTTAPEGEAWRFPPGSRVRCEWCRLTEEPTLVAVQLLD